MKEEILKKVEELFAILQEAKIPGMFIADLAEESIKASNAGTKANAKLMISQLRGDEKLQDYFLYEMELAAAESDDNEDSEPEKPRKSFQELIDEKMELANEETKNLKK